MNPKRIFVDDPLVHYATTTVSTERTKMQIDGILAEYGVKDVMWHWDLPRQVYVMFKIEEEIKQQPIMVGVRVDCPTLWNREKPARGRRNFQAEEINWMISLRAMYHFLKTHLETEYAMQSGKAVAFLAYVQTGNDRQVKDMILPELRQYEALTEQSKPTLVTDAEFTEEPKT